MNASANDKVYQDYVATFANGLQRLGWIEGQNLQIEVRWNAGDAQLARIYAAQLIGLKPDVIIASSTTNLTIVQQATNTVPIVFVFVSDPVGQGFVPNVAKPGGNITGFSYYEFSVGGKWLGLLKEVSPTIARVGVVFNPDTSPQSRFFMRSVEAAATVLGVEVAALAVRAMEDIEPTFERFARSPNGGLVLPTDAAVRPRTKLMAELATRYRLPAIAATSDFARNGGLMAYDLSPSIPGQFHQAAYYVDRILKGTKPGDLPIERADRYRFVLNMKTAKAFGLTVPLPLLGLADEVIE